jgi:uncharacterized metal-binding protein
MDICRRKENKKIGIAFNIVREKNDATTLKNDSFT